MCILKIRGFFMSEDTIFDKILRKEIPADIVYEDDTVIAFNDIAPQAPVHVLVVPKNKIEGFDCLKDSDALETGKYMACVSKVAHFLGLEKDGYRIVFNYGDYGQQTVNYIHAHILGERQLNWPPG